MEDDAAVIGRVLTGEINAYAVLVDKYQARMLRFAANMTSDRAQARDIVQDAFFAAYRKLASFDPARGEFAGWLYRIVRNACLNHLGRHRQLDPIGDFDPAGPNDTEAGLIRRQAFAALDAALAALPHKDRSVFVLAEIEGLSQAEIAAALNVRLGTVKSRLSRAKDKLAKTLKKTLG